MVVLLTFFYISMVSFRYQSFRVKVLYSKIIIAIYIHPKGQLLGIILLELLKCNRLRSSNPLDAVYYGDTAQKFKKALGLSAIVPVFSDIGRRQFIFIKLKYLLSKVPLNLNQKMFRYTCPEKQ